MGHQCTKCGEIYPDAAEELLKGCKCGSKFFYYIKQEKLDELNRIKDQDIQGTIEQLDKADKDQIEKDIREISGLEDEPEKPVILDLESVRVLKPGKFEIDIINLFSKKRPLIYKLEEGKYIIDLAATMNASRAEIDKKIRDPAYILGEKTSKEKDSEQEDDDKDSEEEKKKEENNESATEEKEEEKKKEDREEDKKKEEN